MWEFSAGPPLPAHLLPPGWAQAFDTTGTSLAMQKGAG